MARLGSIVVVLLVLGFSGCVKGDAKDAAASTQPNSVVSAQGDDATGGGDVVGQVIDDQLAPIAAAQVSLDLQVQAVTDQAGQFTFKNVAPGGHKIAAAALGYNSIVKAIDVATGQENRVSLTLTAVAVRGQSYLQLYGPIPGYVNCTFGTPVVAGVCPVVGGVVGGEKSSFNFTIFPETTHVVGELTWQPSSVGTSTLLGSTFSYKGRPNTHWWCFGSDKPPRVKWLYTLEDGTCKTTGSSTQQLPSNTPKKPNETMELQSFVSVPFTTPGSVTLFQKVEVVFSVFVNYDAVPEDYTALPDS